VNFFEERRTASYDITEGGRSVETSFPSSRR